ncbi:quinon protein alcohol dehydrogenase-like superfamily [Dipodascopsis tothii]|uniref:quinon protein alcohol dehydrogenase-like superfamily n=1 Tax=Dipodascopsis tothii TaxID=44089 RepID=UPI0034CD081A
MNIQRCRFVDYAPHSITALAFSHESASAGERAPASLRLAVGRSNGDIELWNPRWGWVHEKTFKGGKNRSIEGLVWSRGDDGLRLFSIGGSTAVTEWDLETGLPLAHHDCNAGIVWSIAASPDGTSLGVGCDDGSVVVVDIAGGRGVLEHKRILQRQKSRVLSLAWRDATQVIGGCADGRVRIWAAAAAPGAPAETAGRLVSTMRIDRATGEDTLVWSVLAIRNGKTIVTGDSTGSVKFWDATHFSLLQSFRAHAADVLCLAANRAGNTVFSAGVDRKIVKYAVVDDKLSRWANMSSRLLHAHDIRALASYEAKGSSFLISGGVERTIVVNSIKNFADGLFRKIPIAPQRPCVAAVAASRLVALWTDNQVKIWSVQKEGDRPKRLVAKLTFNSEENITHGAISADGRYLAVATNAETKLFALTAKKDKALHVRKIEAKGLAGRGAIAVAFDPTGARLAVVSPEADVGLYALPVDDEVTDEVVELERPETEAADAAVAAQLPYLSLVNLVAFSDDGRYVVVSAPSGAVDVFDTRARAHAWTLPRLAATPTAVRFLPDNDTLAVVTAEVKLLLFSVESQALTPWSRRNSNLLPREFLSVVDKCCGIFSETAAGVENRVWMWGATWLAFVDISRDILATRPPKRKANLLAVEDEAAPTVAFAAESFTKKAKAANGKAANGTATPNGKAKAKANGKANGKKTEDDEDEDEDEFDDDTAAFDDWDGIRRAEITDTKPTKQSPRGKASPATSATSSSSLASSVSSVSSADSAVPATLEKSFWMTHKYRPLLLAAPVGDRELLVVERPPYEIPLMPAFWSNHRINF